MMRETNNRNKLTTFNILHIKYNYDNKTSTPQNTIQVRNTVSKTIITIDSYGSKKIKITYIDISHDT
jgi:hypothetical protein